MGGHFHLSPAAARSAPRERFLYRTNGANRLAASPALDGTRCGKPHRSLLVFCSRGIDAGILRHPPHAPSDGGLIVDQPAPTSTLPATGKPSPNDSYVARGLAAASVGLGFFSAVIFFWTPFSSLLASVGLMLGLISVARGVKGGLRGENYAMVGTLLCATSLSITLTLNLGLRYLQWDTLPHLW